MGTVPLKFLSGKRAAHLLAFALLLGAHAETALAYRPFDSTDAAVAGPGEFELEFGPIGRLREGSKRFLVTPAVIANLGLSHDRELVLQGQREVALDRDVGEPRSALVDNGVFVKQVLRRGVLQEESGPSVATEYGFLLPGVRGQQGTGVSVAGIVSQRWQPATVHLNGAVGLTREHDPETFLGVIVEGPYSWAVRPVAEIFTDHIAGSPRLTSRLVGAIWRARENLAFDIGIRSARIGSDAIHEFRLGFTWAFAWKKEP